jgi:hypothetical protein
LDTGLDPNDGFSNGMVWCEDLALQYFGDADKVATYKVIRNLLNTTGCKAPKCKRILSHNTTRYDVTAEVASNEHFAENATIVITASPTGTQVNTKVDYGPFQDDNTFEGVQVARTVKVRDKKACDFITQRDGD